MYYILENNIRVKKWMSGVVCYSIEGTAKQFSLTPEEYALIQRCDGKTELPECNTLYILEAFGVIRRCLKGEADLSPGQIREYPNKLSCVIDWTITERCNYNCLHCFHAADNNIQREEFSRGEALRFLEEAEACGVSAIRLTGGEPTLYPYFREIVEEIRNRGMRLKTLITNGSRMDDELAAFIKSLHPKAQIMLSFDGIGTHDWLRQHEGSEESVRRAIRASKNAGLNVKINMNVNRRNRSVIFDSVKMLANLGVDELRIIKTTEAPIWQSLYLRGRDNSYHILPVKSSRCGYRDDAYICPDMLRKISVQANGEMIPCAPLAGLFSLKGIHMGNVKREGLQKLFTEGTLYEQVTQTVRDKRLANSKCAACRYFINCQGGCPALSIMLGDSLLSSDGYKCVFFEKGYYRKYADALSGTNPEWLNPLLAFLGVLCLIELIVGLVQAVWQMRLFGVLGIRASSRYMWHIFHLPAEFFFQRQPGDLQQNEEANRLISETLILRIVPLITGFLMMLFYAFAMIRYSLFLSAIGFLVVAINLFLTRYIAGRRINILRVMKRDRGKLMTSSMAGVRMIETIKASGSENAYFGRWAGYQANVNEQNTRFEKVTQILVSLPATLIRLSSVLLLCGGVYLVIQGQFSLGCVVHFRSLPALWWVRSLKTPWKANGFVCSASWRSLGKA